MKHLPFIQGWLIALLLLPFAVHADEWRELPYEDIAQMPVMLAKVDTDHVFSTRFQIERADGKQGLPTNLRVEVLASGKTFPVRVDANGGLQLPIRQDWVDAKAGLRVNQPKGSMKLAYKYEARTPPGTRMSYAQLTESVAVMERGIKQAAGLMSFMAPKPYALGIVFPPGPAQQVTLTFADGSSKSFRTSAKSKIGSADNSLELPWNSRWRDAQVNLSAPLRGVMPLLK